jgi:membrane protein DedA with SNARE-associated domain
MVILSRPVLGRHPQEVHSVRQHACYAGAMLEALLVRGGYAFVLGGAMLEGDAVVLAAGAMAHKGLLTLPLVMVMAFLGGLANDVVWFFAGRRYGPSFLARRPRIARRAATVEAWSQRWGTLFVLAFRFLYGFRTIAPAVFGATGYPLQRFLLLDTLSAAVWAASVGAAGYGLGAGLQSLLGRASRLEEALLAGAGVALVLWLVVRRRGQLRKAKSDQALANEHQVGAANLGRRRIV